MAANYKKIIIPSRPHPDVIVGIFLLIKFGQEKYPGIKDASIEIWQELPAGDTSESLEQKGVLLLDVGESKFDHHKTGKNLSQLIAEDLEILWSQPNVFVVPASPFLVYNIYVFIITRLHTHQQHMPILF